MTIEVVRNKVRPGAKIETCDISNAQMWNNHNGTTLMTVPNAQDKGSYLVMVLETNGVIEHTTTMGTFDLVNHLNRFLFEEINCTIELHL